ncbi:MAG: GTPase HflX [Thermoplasmata archaeon]|nr:GTPase HflX [Thermoplasmata archaeon]
MNGIILSAKQDTKEFHQLVETLGYEIEKEFIQIRKGTTPLYLGEGKIEEVKEFVMENNVDAIFVNDALRPSQWFNLEKYLGKKVYDRIRVILEIFAKRASRKEAMLQVQLARLRYERPFVRELFHRVKEGERPGFLAGGEYVVDDYYEMIKRQMKRIREELKKIEEERAIRRRERKAKGFYLISLAGYTNAGKSSLLNTLTGEKVLVEGRLFSTLSTKTSRLKIKSDIPLLVTDTVGFIRDLPHWLIDAFHSTLEEITLADVVILVVDGSESLEELKEKTENSLREIFSLRNNGNDIIIALNKMDMMGREEVNRKKRYIEETFNLPCVPLSAVTGENIEILVKKVHEILPRTHKMILKLPLQNFNGLLSWLSEEMVVENISFSDAVIVELRVNERIRDKIVGRCEKAGGEVIFYED